MKFGKRIKSELVEEWANYYVDYKELKHLLKPLIGKTDEAQEDAFAAAILAEISKVDKFFSTTEDELHNEFRLLCQQVNETHLEVLQTDFSTLDKLFDAHQGTPAGELIRSFLSLSAKVDNMRKFVMINTLAVIKITKKHDKHQQRQLQKDMVEIVHKHRFYCSSRFGTLITDIEVLATQIMSRLTNAQPLAENYSCPICLGILCNPVVLSCGHRFCMKCVSAASYFCQASCPVCRKEQILDMETIKVDTLLSHFLDRYFPEGQSGVKQCKACQQQQTSDPGRQRMPCEDCNLAVLHSLEKMQNRTHAFVLGGVAAPADPHKGQGTQEGESEVKAGEGGGAAVAAVEAGEAVEGDVMGIAPGTVVNGISIEAFDLEVRPRLKRRSVGAGGKQALGGRPNMDADANAPPIMLNAATLRAHFNMPLNDAAKRMGVCATAIKKVCRKIGIKHWPHRKLKAVEKRLALLKAEHRYAGKDLNKEQYQGEIMDLENKRSQLLQGGDCDITAISSGNLLSGKAPAAMNLDQDEDMQGDFDMGGDAKPEAKSPPSQHMHALGAGYPEASVSNHAAQLPASTHEGVVASGSGHSKGHQTRGGAAAGGPSVNEHVDGGVGIHSQMGDVNLFGAQPGYDGGALLTPGEMPRHSGSGEVWMGGAGGDDGGNVWEILHQMMDEPAGQPLGSSSSPRTLMPEQTAAGGGSSTQHMAGSKPTPVFSAGGFDMTDGNVEKLTKRLGSLEEEVLNLRQFTMTLIKERGDLAMRIQMLETELSNANGKNDTLEEELAKHRGRAMRASSAGLSGMHHHHLRGGGSTSPAPEFDFLTHDSPVLSHSAQQESPLLQMQSKEGGSLPSPRWLPPPQ